MTLSVSFQYVCVSAVVLGQMVVRFSGSPSTFFGSNLDLTLTLSSMCQTIDSRTRTHTIPILTPNSAVQSNEVYLTPCSTAPSIQSRLGVR